MEVVGVSRGFGEVLALDDVHIEIRRGEVLAVLGENGAGKTTLMRILGGLDQPTSGHVLRNGHAYSARSPKEAVANGIALVHQHFALVPTMTAAETILLFRADAHRRCGRAEAERQLQQLAAEVGFAIDVERPLGAQSVGEQQRLELLRALDSDPDVLLLDEPTAVLTDDEATAMLRIVQQLAHEQNRAVVLITHRLREVIAAADRVVVLRAGVVVSPVTPVGSRTAASLAAEMVGADVPSVERPASKAPVGEDVLTIHDVTAGKLTGANLSVREGEIVGVAGVDGNGQVELELAVAGLLTPTVGTIVLSGSSLVDAHPRARIEAGVAYLPSDRHAHALIGPMRCDENMLLGRTARFTRSGTGADLDRMRRWAVKGEAHHAAESLSGGNAQKLVAAREFSGSAKFVLACQPTRGLDPGAAHQLRQELVDFAKAGGAVLWISADLDELIDSVDRLYVAFGGQLVGPFNAPFERTEIGLAMGGVAGS